MNILDLLIADGIQAEHASRNEWHSPCPWCQGTDRFSSWPERRNTNGAYMGGRGVCRGCGWHGDAVSFLMKRRGLSFGQACKELEIEPGRMPEPMQHKTKAAWKPAPQKALPSGTWAEKAMGFLLSCQSELEQNPGVRQWLSDERGLSPVSVQRFGIGWNPKDVYLKRESWGLSPELSKHGKPKRLWIPGGLVIPWRDESAQIIRIRIRRTVTDSYGRYIVCSGSSMAPMVIWNQQSAVVVVESELDAYLIHQHAGDIVGVIALGTAQAKPDEQLNRRLMETETVLCCLDSDSAGIKESWTFWNRYPGFKRWPPLAGKDPGDMHNAGIPLKPWIVAGLPETPEPPMEAETVWPPLMPLRYRNTGLNPDWITHCRFLEMAARNPGLDYEIQERAAIIQHDGHFNQIEAERRTIKLYR